MEAKTRSAGVPAPNDLICWVFFFLVPLRLRSTEVDEMIAGTHQFIVGILAHNLKIRVRLVSATKSWTLHYR